MKKYLIPTITTLSSYELKEPFCVVVSDSTHPSDPILAPENPEDEDEDLIGGKNIWNLNNDNL